MEPKGSNMEVNETECRVCKQKKLRVLVGKFNAKDKRYTNEHGKLWNGRKCPECVVAISRENIKKRRELQKSS